MLEAAVDHQAGRSIAVPTALFPMRPIGQETSEVESIYSYIMRLGLAHSLPSRKIVERLATLPDWRRLGLSLGRQWDYRHGLPLMGVGQVASRWASILEVATGANGLQFCTLTGLSRFVCGIGLVARKARVCLQCLSEDEAQGREPYERLWWRVAAAGCCPRHESYLVTPVCSAPKFKERGHFVPKSSGVCGHCGSIGYRCHAADAKDLPTPDEIWVADQVRQLIQNLPAIATADPRVMKDELAHYCCDRGGRTQVAERAKMCKSQMSYWLNRPAAKTSLSQLLDICLAEQFDLVSLIIGKHQRQPVPGSRDPKRVPRVSLRADHALLHQLLEEANEQGVSVTEVAQRAGVNLSTLAKHEDLYLQVREQHQDAIEQAESARRESAIAEAEATYARLVSSGTRPTLRAASALTKESWRESQLRGMSLTLLRISLGEKQLSIPGRYASTGWEYRTMLKRAAGRLRDRFGLSASADPLRRVPFELN